jgi:hypothetical protein
MQSRSKLDDGGDTLPSPGLLVEAPETSSSGEHSSDERARFDSEPVPSSQSAPRPPPSASPDCLDDDLIVAYREGGLASAELHRIDLHLDGCSACRELIEVVIADEPDELTSASQVTTFHSGFAAAGRYEILSFLGKGGMGEVYAALDQLTGKKVALKTVVCTATDDVRAVRKLFDEVLNAQRVAHPHVFKIYDLHEHRDALRGRVPFFTMEFIDGESLGARLRRAGPMPIADAAVIARQLLEGLAAAHARGVLHLDFKSDNVMLRHTSTGFDAVVMDFGLSRAPDAESRQRTSERLQLAGTLPYMSIEQLECQGQLGPPSDVYAFGVVLYEMLTGKLPFRGESYSAILLKQLRERPTPPSALVPGLSPAVDALVLKCLSAQPRDRFSDARQALRAVEALGRWQQPSRAPRRGRSAGIVILGAVVVGAAAAALHGEISARRTPDATPPPLTLGVSAAPTAGGGRAPADSVQGREAPRAREDEAPAPDAKSAPADVTAPAGPAEVSSPAGHAGRSSSAQASARAEGAGRTGVSPADLSAPAGRAEVPSPAELSAPAEAPRPAEPARDTTRPSPPPPRAGGEAEPSAPRPMLPPAPAPGGAGPPSRDWKGPPPQRVPRPRPL